MATLGRSLLILALAVTIYAVFAAIYGGRNRKPEWVVSSRNAMYALFALLTGAFVILEGAFLAVCERENTTPEAVLEACVRQHVANYLRLTAENEAGMGTAREFRTDLFARFLAESSGSEVRMLVLDEGLSVLDGANRLEATQALLGAADRFDKLLVVTHSAELQDMFAQRIVVEKTATGSCARIV